jgi:cholesterol transport system auxiliary component
MTLSVRAVGVALCAALPAGCAVLTPVKSDTTAYVLSKVPVDVPRQGAAHPASWTVLAPEAAPLYATRRMAYSIEPYQVGYFNESEWALPPAQMVQRLLVETLRRMGYVSEIAAATQFGRNTFVLHSEILELKQDFSAEPATFRLAMRFSLERQATHQLIAARALSADEPIPEKTARAGVEAANEATQKLLRAFAGFAVENER